MTISDLLKYAPRYVSIRYYGLNKYVWEKLFPKEYVNRHLYKIKNDLMKKHKIEKMKELDNEASLLVFIFVSKKLFTEGASAAKDTVDILDSLGVDEFFLGTNQFKDRNENVVMGDILADKLMYGVRGVFAEYKRTKIAEIFRLGKVRKAKENHIIATEAPYRLQTCFEDSRKTNTL